jgi:hypothetical protein
MDLDTLTHIMAETLAAHLPGASRDGERYVRLPFGDLRAEVRVERVWSSGVVQQHVWLTGGPLGDRWIEDNFAGFGEDPRVAVVHGVHDWVEGNLQAVRAAFAGEGEPDVDLEIDGVRYQAYSAPMQTRGRAGEALAAAISGPIIAAIADQLPVLHATGPSFVGVYLATTGNPTTVEIKIDGSDWPVTTDGWLEFPPGDELGSVRQLTVLVPEAPRDGWAAAATIRRTLERLPASESGPRTFGAAAHRFATTAPLLELPFDVPEDYRWFVTHVAAAGAGPGYGLLSPVHPAQAPLREGTFDGTEPRGVIALAHHGCNIMALLVCTGAHRGEVWVDDHEGMKKIAGSFRDYYETWLNAAVRRGPTQRVNDPALCALPKALSSFLYSWEERHPDGDARQAFADVAEGSIASSSSGGPYFDAGDMLDHCVGCLDMAFNVGLGPQHMVPGVPPRQAR